MSVKALTIVVGYRDREIDWLQRCLRSLERQTFRDFELIFVDYGSQMSIARAAEETVKKFAFARYVYSDTRGHPWNRSRALNIGGRLATSKYLLTSDVDMVFPPNFLDTVKENAGPQKVLYCAPHFLTRGFNDWDHIEQYAGKFPVGGVGNLGGCAVLPTHVFHDMRGFDEMYQYWGTEDRDMNERLLTLGFTPHWLNDQTYFFHQWHPAGKHSTPGFLPLGEWGRMQKHFYQHLGEVTRNSPQWGRVLHAEDRPIFKLLDLGGAVFLKHADVEIVDLLPDENKSLSTLITTFRSLSPGQAIAVKHAMFPRRTRWTTLLIALGNSLARLLKTDARFDYAPNLLHSFISEFISQDDSTVADYYLNFPSLNGVSVLMHS